MASHRPLKSSEQKLSLRTYLGSLGRVDCYTVAGVCCCRKTMIVSSKENWVRGPFRRIRFGCHGKSGCVVKLHGFSFSYRILCSFVGWVFTKWMVCEIGQMIHCGVSFSFHLRDIFFLEDIIIGFHQPPTLVTKTSKNQNLFLTAKKQFEGFKCLQTGLFKAKRFPILTIAWTLQISWWSALESIGPIRWFPASLNAR